MISYDDFSFAETHACVFISFYKTPNDIKHNIRAILNPTIKLPSPKVLMFNDREIPLFAEVTLEKVDNRDTRTDVVLRKAVPVMWNCLNGETFVVKVNEEVYKDEDGEKKEPKDMMSLLKDIFESGDPDVKRAMNKSMTESGGTVLSTNWKDVATKNVQPEN